MRHGLLLGQPVELRHQPLLEGGRRFDRLGEGGEHRRRLGMGIGLGAQFGRRGGRVLERRTLVGVERVERVRRGELVHRLERGELARGSRLVGVLAVVVSRFGHVVTPNADLSRIMPSRSRVFTVPSGTSSRSAISRCVRPS